MMTERFTVPGDPFRIAGLFRILQDVSGHAAACWHASGPELMEKGLMWVVTRYELSLDRALIPGEALDITTWASPVRHMLSQRPGGRLLGPRRPRNPRHGRLDRAPRCLRDRGDRA